MNDLHVTLLSCILGCLSPEETLKIKLVSTKFRRVQAAWSSIEFDLSNKDYTILLASCLPSYVRHLIFHSYTEFSCFNLSVIENFNNLTSLDLDSFISPNPGKLTKLKTLDVTYNAIVDATPDLINLQELRSLNLSHSKNLGP